MRTSPLATTTTLLVVLTFAGAAQAEPSPFHAMAGSWAGSGTLSMASGERERLRCRAAYNVGGSGAQLRLNIRCASDSYNIDLSSDVAYRGGEISGEWAESSHNASGTIAGHASGDRIEAQARGQSFSAGLSLTTRGSRQVVSIRPAGAEITAVNLELQRR